MMKRNINLNRISLFLEIVKTGSITKTAEIFNLQKSKVSRDLSLLEQELGAQLIYRTTRQFNLTTEGQRFFEKAQKSISYLEEAIIETSGEAKSIAGHISITCPEDIGEIILVPILEEFSRIYPKVSYGIHFSTEVMDLVANKIDLAIRPGRLKDSSIKMKKIGFIDFGLYCSENLYKSLHNINSYKQLSELPTIYFDKGTKEAMWQLSNRGKVSKVTIHPIAKVNSYLAAFRLIDKGMGIGLLPKFIVTQSTNNGLVHILKDWEAQRSDLHLIYPDRSEDIARVRVLMDFIAKKMSLMI